MKLQLVHFNSLISLVTYFNNDKRCRDFITEQRWGANVVCPFCGCTHTPALEGEIELDEMYLGGRETNKHQSKKTPIFGMVQRDGIVHALKVTDTKASTLLPIIKQFCKENAHFFTDELSSYVCLERYAKGFLSSIYTSVMKFMICARGVLCLCRKIPLLKVPRQALNHWHTSA